MKTLEKLIITPFNFKLFGAGDVVHGTAQYINANGGQSTNYTDGAGLSPEMRTYYSDYLIDLAEPKLVHSQFGQKHPIPKNGGKTIQFRKYDNLPKLTTPLKEGVTPTGQKMNATTVETTVNQFGGFVELSDMLLLAAVDNNLVQATKLLASQAGRTIDTIVREVLNSGTNVQFADGSVSASYLISGGSNTDSENNYLTVDYIKRAVRALKTQNAETIDGDYVCIIHPDAAYDLTKDDEWKYPHQYKDTAEIYSGEIGKIAGCRFVETTEAKVWHAEDLSAASRNLTAQSASGATITIGESLTTDDITAIKGRKVLIGSEQLTVSNATASSITLNKTPAQTVSSGTVIYPGEAGAKGRDLYSTLIIGDNAYGITEITGGGLEHIVKQLGSSGTADPLNQRATAGWKCTLAAIILVQQYMIRIETASTFEIGAN